MKRIVLSGVSAILLAVSLGSGLPPAQYDTSSGDPFTLTLTSAEVIVIPNDTWGLNWVPDENISFINSGGDIHMWLAARKETYYLRGATFDVLSPHEVDTNGRAIPVLVPSGSGFDKDYAGSSAVIRA